jgi:hypothetical protein
MSRFPAKFGRVTVRHVANNGPTTASSPVNRALDRTQGTENYNGKMCSRNDALLPEYQKVRTFGQELCW